MELSLIETTIRWLGGLLAYTALVLFFTVSGAAHNGRQGAQRV